MEQKVYPVCVIGGGSAGTMAALRTVLNNDECLFFPGTPKDKKKSRALWVRKVENMPAHLSYTRGIEEPNAETIKWIAESEFKEKLIIHKNVGVVSVKKENDIFVLTDSKNNIFHAEHVILCTGVMDVQPEIQGSIDTIFDYANAQTVDYCLICDGHHVLNKRLTVIGHTNSTAWVAIMLHERYQPKSLTILTNGKKAEFQEDTTKLMQAYGFEIEETPILGINGSDKGKVLEGFQLESGVCIDSDISFVSLGMIVYNELAKQLGANLDPRGFVIGDENGLTSISGLYVAGDLKANTRKQIYTAWDNAVSAANAINMKLRQKRRPQV